MGCIPESYEDALNSDDNVIHESEYFEATKQQAQQLIAEQDTIKALTRHHMGIGAGARVMIDFEKCTIGNFNICFPLTIKHSDAPPLKLYFRCAMPHKLGELRSAGAVDEKMRCEVATYAWMQQNCSDIRIPYLYGFGLTDHRQFTHDSHRPLLARVMQFFRRIVYTWLRPSAVLSRYVSHTSRHRLSTAYMLLEDVSSDGSKALVDTWSLYGDDPQRRQNFYRGLSRTILSLARVPQHRIGAFRFHDDGTLTLSNRPLTTNVAILENDGAPCCVPRDRTYATTEAYVSDMLSFHKARLTTNPNPALDAADCRSMMASQVGFQAVSNQYILPDRREGPFFLQFDDISICNIFVDDDWNIRSLVDLEWINAQPLEMMRVPHWLVDGDLADFEGGLLERFEQRRRQFIEVFREEECRAAPTQDPILTNMMNWSWEHGGSWFWIGLTSVNAIHAMFSGHICPQGTLSYEEESTLSQFWCPNSEEFVERKELDIQAYRKKLYDWYNRDKQ